MSLYSDDKKILDDPRLKKAAEACKKDVYEVIKKHFTEYIEESVTEWLEKELKRMGLFKGNK